MKSHTDYYNWLKYDNEKKLQQKDNLKKELVIKRNRILYLETSKIMIEKAEYRSKCRVICIMFYLILCELYLLLASEKIKFNCSVSVDNTLSCTTIGDGINNVISILLIPLIIASIANYFSERSLKSSALLGVEKELYELYYFIDINDVLSNDERERFKKYTSEFKKTYPKWQFWRK